MRRHETKSRKQNPSRHGSPRAERRRHAARCQGDRPQQAGLRRRRPDANVPWGVPDHAVGTDPHLGQTFGRTDRSSDEEARRLAQCSNVRALAVILFVSNCRHRDAEAARSGATNTRVASRAALARR